MPFISSALAGALLALDTFNITEIPIRSVAVCADRAEIVRQVEFDLAGKNQVLVFRATPDMNNVQFKFTRADIGQLSTVTEIDARSIPVEVTYVSPGEYRIKIEKHENLRLVGELRYNSAKVKITTVTKISLGVAEDTAELQTIALISQTTGTAWKRVPVSYHRTCDQRGLNERSYAVQMSNTVKVNPVLVHDSANYPRIDNFYRDALDVGGMGEPVTVVLDERTANVEQQRRATPLADSIPIRYVVLPADKPYGEKILIHDGSRRTFEAHGHIRAGKLEFPIGWAK